MNLKTSHLRYLSHLSHPRKVEFPNDELCKLNSKVKSVSATRIHRLDRRIVKKKPHFDDFEVKYLQTATFSEK